MSEFAPAIVIDNGSGMIKAGCAKNDMPTAVFPNIIGRPRTENMIHGSDDKELYIGNEAQDKRGILSLSYPLDHGVIENWKDMEMVWEHCYQNELRVNSEDAPAMLTEAPLNPKENKAKMVGIFFERFGVPAFYIAIQAILSLYSKGDMTGVVFDSGDGVTHIVPVCEGYALSHAIPRINIAGRDITEHLIRLLFNRGVSMRTTAEKEVTRLMKEKLCYVEIDPDKAMNNDNIGEFEKIYEMPDGQTISIGTERFMAPEVLFQPNLMGYDVPGVHLAADACIKSCDLDIRKALYGNIMLSGGSTMFTGLPERLHKELSERAPLSTPVKITSPPERKYSVWIGGKILCSLSSFHEQWISKEEFNEVGPNIVHRKCF